MPRDICADPLFQGDNLTRRIPINDLTARVKGLEEELIALRSRFAKMEARERARGDDFEIMDEAPEAPTVKAMGRRPLVSDQELRKRLERLLPRLGGVWPQFESAINEARDADHLAVLLREKCPARDGDHTFQRLLLHRSQMWEFVTSDRYNRTPDQFACAMAGIPEMKPRSSLDKCLPMLHSIDPGRMRLY